MKQVLFISPAFANNGVVCKYDIRYINSWKDICNFTIATKKGFNNTNFKEKIIESKDFFSYPIQRIQAKYFKNKEFIIPDSNRITILPFLYKICCNYIKNNKIDIIHTVSFPCSSHLLGAKLKKEFGIPWIAHFYDPWVDNPYRNIPSCKQKKDKQFEALVAKEANAIIHSNNIIKDCWIKRYGNLVKDKIHIIPFGYSVEQIKSFKPFEGKLPQHKKVIISYIGTCAGDRNFQSLIKAVNILITKNSNYKDNLEIRLLGNLLPNDKTLIDKKNLWDVFTFVGRKSQSELPFYYQNSDIFLVIDSPQEKNVFFPSKLIDYFYYQRPILGISPQIGVTNEFLSASGHFCYENNDIEGIAQYLEKAIINFPELLNYNREFYCNFFPDVILNDYQNVINNICNGQ